MIYAKPDRLTCFAHGDEKFVNEIHPSCILGNHRGVSFRPESGLHDGAARTLSLRTRVEHTGRLRPASRV